MDAVQTGVGNFRLPSAGGRRDNERYLSFGVRLIGPLPNIEQCYLSRRRTPYVGSLGGDAMFFCQDGARLRTGIFSEFLILKLPAWSFRFLAMPLLFVTRL
jgi:hypothetical protein